MRSSRTPGARAERRPAGRGQVLSAACLDSPIGPLRLLASPAGLAAIVWRSDPCPPAGEARDPVLEAAVRQLREYFRGERREFDVPLDLHGTAFQVAAWRALAEVPFGETRTYAEQARLLGRAGSARAVGAANARNPLPVVLPCHRLVGAGGDLRGYAGGLPAKGWLLEHERRVRGG